MAPLGAMSSNGATGDHEVVIWNLHYIFGVADVEQKKKVLGSFLSNVVGGAIAF